MFIKEFIKLTTLLIQLTYKKAIFKQIKHYQKAFQNLKKQFIKGSILAIYNYNKETRLELDVLKQTFKGFLI